MKTLENTNGGASFTSIFNILSPLFIVLVALLCIASIIALGVIFKKHNKIGLLAIVPLVNTYVLFKIFWDTNKFWTYMALSLLMGALSAIQMFLPVGNFFEVLLICANLIIAVVILVYNVMLYAKMAKAYGYGTGFAVGLLLFNPIFTIILATKRPVMQA